MNTVKNHPPYLGISRRLRSTPFTEGVKAANVKAYTVYNHMLLATMFESVEADYWHLLKHVQIWDVGAERQVAVQGPDAKRLIQLMTPRDLSLAKAGRCFYIPLVDENGGMVNDPLLLKFSDEHFWVSIADSDVLLWAKGLAMGYGLDVSIDEPDVWPLAIQGPLADDLASRIFGEEVREIKFFGFRKLPFKGHDFIVARSGWSKQGGFEIYVDNEKLAMPLWNSFLQHGEDLNLRVGCPNLIERIEGGLLSYGNDMNLQNSPFDCGLDIYCDLQADIEFLGKDALLKIRDEKRHKISRGLFIDGENMPALTRAWDIFDHKKNHCGVVTSACYSPYLKRNIAFAMIEIDQASIDNSLSVHMQNGEQVKCHVAKLPFVDKWVIG